MKRFVKTAVVILICLAAAAAAFSAGFAAHMVLSETPHKSVAPQLIVGETLSPAQDETGAFEVFWQAWHLVEQNYLGAVPPLQTASYGAIRGVLNELNDPHTLFVEPRRRELERDEHRGRFGGIGVWVYQREDDREIVLVPQEGGPAARAGILDGDAVRAVEDTLVDTAAMTRDDVVALIRGPVGEPVRLVIWRAARQQELTFKVEREEFSTPSVQWRMLDDQAQGVGYILITLFTERTGAEVEDALKQLTSRGATRLVIDLRDNPGGLLDAAIDVASQFLDGGVVMYEQSRDGAEKPYPALKGGTARTIPLVVLINGGTASASEIIAGAIQDSGRGLLIGETSYGKGSVQLVFDLVDGSSLHVTVARWLTPARHQIDGAGIAPDQTVSPTDDDRALGRDAQLAAAVEQIISLAKTN